MQPYTLEHTLPPYVTLDSYTRPDGALYISARDEILNTNTAATVDPCEMLNGLCDRLYYDIVHQITRQRAWVAVALCGVVSRGLLPYVEHLRAMQILQALGNEPSGHEYVPCWGREDKAEEYSLAAECDTYAEYTIKTKLRGNTPLCREDYVLIVEYRKVIKQYFTNP